MLLVSTIVFASAPPASAVPTPTRSQANNNAPMGFFASDGDAPNPASFCESPDYFDEWNVNPAATSQDGPWTIDTGAGQFGGGVTATLTENSEPVLQGQAKWGIRFGGGAQGTVTLSEPIFYSQWIASDMDINGEGFEATATYNGLAAPVTATAAFGANTGHTVTTTQPNMATIVKNTNGGTQPWTLTGRSQVDFLGPVDEVFWNKTGASGWIAGFMPAMGCAAFGSAKEVSSPSMECDHADIQHAVHDSGSQQHAQRRDHQRRASERSGNAAGIRSSAWTARDSDHGTRSHRLVGNCRFNDPKRVDLVDHRHCNQP